MSGETGPGHETYMVGGNLLNEQDRIAGEKDHHSGHGDRHAADPVEDGGAEGGTVEDRPVEDRLENTSSEEPSGTLSADDDLEQPAPGAVIPDQPADSITEEQNTEGGGSVPPGSADAGHTVRRRW